MQRLMLLLSLISRAVRIIALDFKHTLVLLLLLPAIRLSGRHLQLDSTAAAAAGVLPANPRVTPSGRLTQSRRWRRQPVWLQVILLLLLLVA